MKVRIKNYCYSLALIVSLCGIFSHGPHGGWVLGFIISCYFGMMISAALWLLKIKGWLKYVLSILIPLFSLASGIYLIKKAPELITDWLTNILYLLILLLDYVFWIEISNLLARKKANPTP